jgi:HEAT repeat protein
MIRMLSLLVLAAPGAAWAGPKRDAVMDLLNAFEDTVREADLAALGDGVDAELMEIADDAQVPTTRRARAISGLQYYRTDTVRTFLEKHLETKSSVSMLRRKAAASLAAWGPTAVATLAPVLGDSDVQLRIAVAQALGRIGDDPARKLLQDRLAAEPEPAVKEAITKSLGVQR